MSAVVIRRRDPADIAARTHSVLDSAARSHGDVTAAAEHAVDAMALLLLSVSVFLGGDAADQMMRDAAEVTR